MGKRREWSPIVQGDITLIPLTQGKLATIDVADLPLVLGLPWQAVKGVSTFYATRRLDGPRSSRRVKMHRIILGLVPGDPDADHIDGDGLNNRRSNLRPATRTQNNANSRPRAGTSRFKGVCWHKAAGKWMAQITVGYDRRYLGLFNSEIDAARAYDEAAALEWGAMARPNFPARSVAD